LSREILDNDELPDDPVEALRYFATLGQGAIQTLGLLMHGILDMASRVFQAVGETNDPIAQAFFVGLLIASILWFVTTPPYSKIIKFLKFDKFFADFLANLANFAGKGPGQLGGKQFQVGGVVFTISPFAPFGIAVTPPATTTPPPPPGAAPGTTPVVDNFIWGLAPGGDGYKIEYDAIFNAVGVAVLNFTTNVKVVQGRDGNFYIVDPTRPVQDAPNTPKV
jgi:hypothetical protein